MREKFLKKLSYWHTKYPWRMLTIIIMVTIIMGVLSRGLRITMRTEALLPEGDKRVEQFNRITEEFTTATNLLVVVQGDETRMKEFADELAPKILGLRHTSNNKEREEEISKLQEKIQDLREKQNKVRKIEELQNEIGELQSRINFKLFQRIDYKAETDFLRNHALLLVKEDDLKNTKEIFTSPNLTDLIRNINDSMEKEYVGRQESISTREKEDGAWNFLDGIQNLVFTLMDALRKGNVSEKDIRQIADRLLFGEPYMLSYDKEALVMIAVPNFSIMDREMIMVSARAVQKLVDDTLKGYPDLTAGLSGAIAREHDEQVASEEAISSSTIIALIFILILLIAAFRMWVAPVFAIVTLITGLIWALGATFLVVGQLNMVTAMMAVVLLGLGIDFAIHFISGFTEWRAAGDTIPVAMEKVFLKSGKGIITGGLTTACAFLTLLISRSRGMKEMGIVVGMGLLCVLLATLFFLPAMLVFRARIKDRLMKKSGSKKKSFSGEKDISFGFLGGLGEFLSRRYVFSIVSSVALSAVLVYSAFQITFDPNFLNMEPKGLTSIALSDTVMNKFDLSMEYALVLADSVEESRNLAEQYRELGSVALTDDISIYLPSKEEQNARIPHITDIFRKISSARVNRIITRNEISGFVEEIDRLMMNIMEIQDMAFIGGQDKVDNKCKILVGDPDKDDPYNAIEEFKHLLNSNVSESAAVLTEFQRSFAPAFRESVMSMCRTEPINLEDLPESVLDRYSNKTRDKFLVTIFPAGNIWDGNYLYRFVDDLERVSDKVTGMPPVAVALIRIFGRDGRNAVLLTLVIVFLLLWADFGRARHALTAMIPLALGMFWMVGLMNLTGQQLTIMNVIGLPLIIGIGIDDGVHIMHRWKHEGNGRIRTVYSSTGKAILLTSLTTMFAFGSLVFSVFRGWAQFGLALFTGVGACFLTTVFVLPGILGLIEKKNGKRVKDRLFHLDY